MHFRKDQLRPQAEASELISVRKLAIDALADFGVRLRTHAISIELDLEGGQTSVQSHQVLPVIRDLIEHAIESMPEGGELTVTLVDGGHQWELEFADSGPEVNRIADGSQETTAGLLTLVPYCDQEKLQSARQAANRFGGDVVSWECPEGGSAHVLVFPIRHQEMTG